MLVLVVALVAQQHMAMPHWFVCPLIFLVEEEEGDGGAEADPCSHDLPSAPTSSQQPLLQETAGETFISPSDRFVYINTCAWW